MDSTSYDKASSPQHNFNLEFLREVVDLKIFETVVKNCGKSINFAEYGCATGLNSIEWIQELLRHTGDKEVNICMSDLETNNFKICSKNISENIRSEKVFTNFAFKSFYEKVYANSSIDIAVCNNAIHWLSEQEWHNDDSLIPQFSKDKETVEKLRKAAEKDYINFFKLREAEIKENGYLMVGSPCDTEHMNSTDVLFEAWSNLVTKYKIEKIRKYLSLPFYRRSEEEIKKPFVEKLVNFEIVEFHMGAYDLSVLKESEGTVKFMKPLIGLFLSMLLDNVVPQIYPDVKLEKDKFMQELFDEFKRLLDLREKPNQYLKAFHLVLKKKTATG
jgi:hypothetical protein